MKKWFAMLAAVSLFCSFSAVKCDDALEGTDDQNVFNGFYTGLGLGGSYIGATVNDTTSDARIPDLKIKKIKLDRFMGCFVLGGGKAIGGFFYLGLEGTIDFSKSKMIRAHSDCQDAIVKQEIEKYYMKSRSIVPGVGFRVGFVIPSWKTLVYVKPNFLFPRIRLYDDKNKILGEMPVAPGAAFGIEKYVSCGLSARAEVEYAINFSRKKKINVVGVEHEVKASGGRGLNFRLSVCYNFNH